METIFVVSPEYLSAVFAESKKYDFQLQGYGSFRSAVKGIVRVNAQDLLGIAFLGETLPRTGSGEYANMLECFRMCDLMQSDKKAVLIVRSGVAGAAKDLKQFRNVRVYEVSGYDVVSDTLINRSLFGSILLDSYEPYRIKKEKTGSFGQVLNPKLECRPVVGEQLLSCISEVDVLDTLKHTVEYDNVYNTLKDMGSELELYRMLYIKKVLGVGCDYEESAITTLLQRYQHEGSRFWPIMLAMFEYIKTGGRHADDS